MSIGTLKRIGLAISPLPDRRVPGEKPALPKPLRYNPLARVPCVRPAMPPHNNRIIPPAARTYSVTIPRPTCRHPFQNPSRQTDTLSFFGPLAMLLCVQYLVLILFAVLCT